MNDVLVLGGGYAGVWSAAGAVRLARSVGNDELRVRLISTGDDMVICPRLYARNPDKMRISLDSLLGPMGVDHIHARVESVDVDTQTITARSHDGGPLTAHFDRLVLATGSNLNRPSFPGSVRLFDIDTFDAAVALDTHLHRLPQRSEIPGRYTVASTPNSWASTPGTTWRLTCLACQCCRFTSDPYSNCFDRIVEKAGGPAKAVKQAINTQCIYPPANSAELLLAKAGHFSNGA